MAVLGLGLAALGRPGYLTVDHGASIGPDRSVEALRQRCQQVCDAAREGGSGGPTPPAPTARAEEFLAGWLRRRAIEPGRSPLPSKWGYTYTADWNVDAEVPGGEGPLRHRPGPAVAGDPRPCSDRGCGLYQVHSATLESGDP